MANLHMEGLGDLELAEYVDQALASLNARYDDPELASTVEGDQLANAIERACDAWDEFADLLPGFRDEEE